MKRRRYVSEPEPPPSSGGIVESITRFWLTTLVILVILYAAVMFISRSDGFRDILQQRLSLIAGIPITVEQSSADPWLNVNLQGIVGGNVTNNTLPSLSIGHATLKWRWIPLLRGDSWPFKHLEVRDATLRFTLTTNGVWQPFPQLHDMISPWMKLPVSGTNQHPQQITEAMRQSGTRVTVENGTIRWVSGLPDEPPLALVEGIQGRSEVIKPFDDEYLWCTMRITRAETEEVEWLKELAVDWVRTPDRDVVVRLSGTILAEEQRIWQRDLLHKIQ